MKRPQGAPPVTLCVVTTAILVLHLALVLYIHYQITRLEARVHTANIEFADIAIQRNFEEDPVPVQNRPMGRLTSDVALLAAFQELNRTVPEGFWLTGLFFLGSLVWLRSPRST